MSVVIFDLEFTTWEGTRERNWSGPNEWREVVQIGALRVNPLSLAVEAELDLLVRPVRNPVLSDFFSQLTGITQAEVEAKGLDFPESFQRFVDFAAGAPIWAYGGDANILAENLGFHGLLPPPGWPGKAESNLAPWLHQHAPETRGVNSGRLVEALGVRARSGEHTGLGDCHSILESIRFLVEKKGIPAPFSRT